jgi:hypothetical protein
MLFAADEEILRRVEESDHPGMKAAQDILHRIHWYEKFVAFVRKSAMWKSTFCIYSWLLAGTGSDEWLATLRRATFGKMRSTMNVPHVSIISLFLLLG